MTIVNLLSNPSGRRTITGYTFFGGTSGQDPNADTYVRASGAVNPANLGIVLEAMTVGSGGKLSPNTTYTFSAYIYGSATSVRLRVFGTGVTATADSPDAPGTFARVSATFTTGASGTVSFYVVNSTAAVTGNIVAFRDAQVEPGAVANPYLDGNAANYMWSAAPDASTTWGPVVTVVPNPAFTPPRNEVTLSIPPGQVMSGPVLSRLAGGVATLAPIQPAGGFDTRTVYDYESPYDQQVAYQLLSSFYDPNGISTVWDETWPNLSAWTPSGTGSWSVSGGVASATVSSIGTGPSIARAVASGKYRITCASLGITGVNVNAAKGSGIFLMNGSTVVLQIAPLAGGGLQIIRNGVVTSTPVSGSAPFTIDLSGTSVVLSGTGGSTSVAVNGTITSIKLTASGPGTTSVGRITVGSYATTYSLSGTSGTVALSPAAPWLIHPGNPALSIPVGSHDRSTAMIRTLSEVGNDSQAVDHVILGQDLPITTTSGPRMGNKLQAVIGVRTAAQEQALNGLLKDGTAILFRAPASYPIGLEEGYYSVGNVTRARLSQRLGDPMRDFTLPLTQVQRPAVTVQNTGWSWAALAAQFPTWQAVAAAFNTWADVLTNNRKPGY